MKKWIIKGEAIFTITGDAGATRVVFRQLKAIYESEAKPSDLIADMVIDCECINYADDLGDSVNTSWECCATSIEEQAD